MYLVHNPPEGPAERYDLDELSTAESEAMERATGHEWSELETLLQKRSPTAMRAALWVWRKRKEPTLRFAEFDVPNWRKRLKVLLSAEEVADVVEQIHIKYADNPGDHAQALRELEQLADDPASIQAALQSAGPKEAPAAGPGESGSAG